MLLLDEAVSSEV